MANPRQRRKAKSSTYKAIQHSRRAKRLQKKMPAIRGPKALQDAWDPSKTLRQNYLALGLEHDLNPIASGGTEVILGRVDDQAVANESLPKPWSRIDDARSAVSERSAATCAIPDGFGRIIRDPSGNVVRVELPNDEDAESASKRGVLADATVAATESELRIWANDRLETREGCGVSENVGHPIIQDLENFATSVTVRQRHTSSGERSYLERLVSKYGDDLHRMARDRRLNPEQRTAGELKRAIARAGGVGALCEGTATAVAG